MQLVMLLLVLLLPRWIAALVARRAPSLRVPPSITARIGVSLFFGVTSTAHFTQTNAMAEMLPPIVPARRTIIYSTGVLELLGAVGLWIPRLERLAGRCLTLMMIGLLPANVYAAWRRVAFGGHARGPAYLLVRVPFQGLVIWRIYQAALARRAPSTRS
jgi:uncharacterized membrane protein